MARPAPLGPVSTPALGQSNWSRRWPAVSLVALAGAGALLATRGWGRRLVGALIVVGGLAAAGLALSALGRDGDRRGLGRRDRAGGLVAAGAGAFALVRGAAWPCARGAVRAAARTAVGSTERGDDEPTVRTDLTR